MDNNSFDNNTFGAQPQKPFTDKTGNPPAQSNENITPPTYDFEPQKPLINNAEEAPADNQQSDAANVQSVPQQDFSQQPSQYAPPAYPVQEAYAQAPNGYPQSNQGQPAFQQPVYSSPAQQNGYNQPQGGYAQNAPQGYAPPQAPNAYPKYNNSLYYNRSYQPAPPAPQKPQKSGNKGLIAVIIVLSVLLAASVIGMLAFVFTKSPSNTVQSQNNNSSFTVPNGGYYQVPETTAAPQTSHDESDYSDKVVSDYKGLDLQSKPKDAKSNTDYTADYAYNKASNSVVGVLCYAGEATDSTSCDSQGSGIIITSDGYVITNAHVVGNSKTTYSIKVVTADGKEYTAGVVGIDSRTDIAVLKMDDAKDLTAATFGNSDEVELGEDIIVIGNPGGLDFQNSLTKGIVSAINRETSSTSLVKYIQTDAAINPGNSGGPIVNLYGQVIGIATSKIVSEKYEGMGFAIPSVTAKEIVDSLMKYSYVDGRVKIGITGQSVTSSVSSEYGLPQGILVAEISADGPCANSGLMVEDIITEIDGQAVTTFSQVYEILENHKEGDKVTLTYYRYSSNTYGETDITLQADK